MKIHMKSMLNIIVGFTFLWRFITSFVSLPSVLSFFSDVVLIGALIVYFVKLKNCCIPDHRFHIFIAFFSVVCIISFWGNATGIRSIFYLIWGLRNQFRFLLFYLIALVCLNSVDYNKLKSIIYKLLILETILVSIQFFILGYRNDFASGIFGTDQGGNGIANVFICIISIWALVDYINKEISTKKFASLILQCLYVATIMEIKYYYIEIVLLASITILVSKKTNRKYKVVAGIALAVVAANQLLSIYYPYFAQFFTIENILTYIQNGALGDSTAREFLTGYSRTEVLPGVTNTFLSDNWFARLFGLGLGNTDSSPIALCNSGFADQYRELLYANYHFSMVYIETGCIGLALFILSFLWTITQGIKYFRKENGEHKYSLYIILLGILGILVFFYDSSLRTASSGYLYYYVLAISFIYAFNSKNKQQEEYFGLEQRYNEKKSFS